MIQQRQVGAFRPELQRQGPLQGSPLGPQQQRKGFLSQAASLGADKFAAAALKGTPFAFLSPLAGSLFNDGGEVAGSLPPEVQGQLKQLLQALASGQVSPQQAVEMLVQAGVPQEQALQMVRQAVGAIQQQTAQPAPQEAQQSQPGVSSVAGGSHPLTPAAAAAKEGPLGLNAGGFAKDPDGNTLPSGMVWDRDLGKAITFGEKSRRLQVQHAQRAAHRRNTVGTEGYSTNAKNYERMRANPGQAPVKVGGMNVGGSVGHNPDTFINGQIASVHYPNPGPSRNAPPVGPLGYARGGEIQTKRDAMRAAEKKRAREAGEYQVADAFKGTAGWVHHPNLRNFETARQNFQKAIDTQDNDFYQTVDQYFPDSALALMNQVEPGGFNEDSYLEDVNRKYGVGESYSFNPYSPRFAEFTGNPKEDEANARDAFERWGKLQDFEKRSMDPSAIDRIERNRRRYLESEIDAIQTAGRGNTPTDYQRYIAEWRSMNPQLAESTRRAPRQAYGQFSNLPLSEDQFMRRLNNVDGNADSGYLPINDAPLWSQKKKANFNMGGGVGPLTGFYKMGGTVNPSSPGYYTHNNGGKVPLSSTQPHGPMHLNGGGMANKSKVKMVKKKQKMQDGGMVETEIHYDTAVPPISDAAMRALG